MQPWTEAFSAHRWVSFLELDEETLLHRAKLVRSVFQHLAELSHLVAHRQVIIDRPEVVLQGQRLPQGDFEVSCRLAVGSARALEVLDEALSQRLQDQPHAVEVIRLQSVTVR